MVFDDILADIEGNKKLSPIVSKLLLRGTKLSISLVFTSQSYLKGTKTKKLNATHFLSWKYLMN